MDIAPSQAHINTALETSIIRTLLYFDLFHYPLTSEEVYRFLGRNHTHPSDVSAALDELTRKGLTFKHLCYYGFEKSRSSVLRRMKGNRQAANMHELATRRAQLIGKFPFVLGVMASGSFSKGYMDANSDLDFFVITKAGKLWITRMLIALFKRVFLLNSHKYFCCNYFIDEHHLLIDEKNLFTATELSTLIPLYGEEYYEQLIAENGWLYEYFPNFKRRKAKGERHAKGLIKKMGEGILRGKLADVADSLCMKLTLRRWKRLYGTQYSRDDFELAFKTRTYVSKNHPRHFQRNVMARYEERIKRFEGVTFG